MSEFKINVKPLRKEKENLDSIKKTIQKNRDQVDSIANNLSLSGNDAEHVKQALKEIAEILDSISKTTSIFGIQLSSILDHYEKTENKIANTTINISNPQTTTGSGNTTDNEPSNDDKENTRSTSGGGRRRGRHEGGRKYPDFIYDCDYKYSQYNISVPVCPEFLKKDNCLLMAEKIIGEHGKDGLCNDMDALRIAQELYFHAVLYYFTAGPALEWLEDLLGDKSDVLLSKHADPADIGLGDDLDLLYSTLWYYQPVTSPAFPIVFPFQKK